jgi:hypothetical protein
VRSKTAEQETQVAEGGSSANLLRNDVEASGLLKGSLEEIVGGQVQSVIFWTPWCVLLNPFLSRRILKRPIYPERQRLSDLASTKIW